MGHDGSKTHFLTVRLAVFADLDGVMSLLEGCVAGMRAAGIVQWDEVYPDRATLSADIQGGTLYGGYVEASLVGIIVINDYQNGEYEAVRWAFHADRVAVVHRLMVSPSHEGQGIARRLMAFAEAHASECGYHVMRLDAFTKNPRALRLYDRLGYHDAGGVTFRKGEFRCFEKKLAEGR